jgi:hypothetical protein
LFLIALGGHPFHGSPEVVVNGLYLGLVSGFAWGVSVLRSGAWNNIWNYVAALFTLLSLAYLTSDTLANTACAKNAPPTLLCHVVSVIY